MLVVYLKQCNCLVACGGMINPTSSQLVFHTLKKKDIYVRPSVALYYYLYSLRGQNIRSVLFISLYIACLPAITSMHDRLGRTYNGFKSGYFICVIFHTNVTLNKNINSM